MKKVITHVPVSHADIVRDAIGRAGGGKFKNYSFCSFSVRGTGRFLPEAGAHPAIGIVGKLESVEEEQIGFICEDALVDVVIRAIKKVHPYEEIPFEIYNIDTAQ